MDKEEYYTKLRLEQKKEIIVDGDRKTVGGRPWCQVTIKEFESQTEFNFTKEN